MSSKTIITTKNYRLFQVSEDNRPLNVSNRKALRDSMKKYGFLKSFPISCIKRGGKLIVKDGQNRLALAEELGLAVHYIIEDVDYDIATINNAQEKWTLRDYAMKWAANGKDNYATLLEFIESHSIPISLGISLLCGYLHTNGDLTKHFKDGKFKVLDYDFADQIAGVYTQLTSLSKEIKTGSFLAALIAAMRVEGFDPKRLVDCAKKRPEKLKHYATRDSYLEMIEDVYNFNRSKLIAIKMPALQVLRERSVSYDASAK